MKVRPPKDLAGFHNIRGFMQSWDFRMNWPTNKVEFDLTANTFVEPWALALIAAWGKRLEVECGREISFILDEKNPSNKYFQQFGLPQLFGKKPLNDIDERYDYAFPLTAFRTSKEVPAIAKRFVEIVGLNAEYARSMANYCIIELLRNVVQHSGSSIGGIAGGQYFPDTRKVQIVVVDIGVGIPSTIRKKYNVKGDLKALKLSLLPHVSGTFEPGAYESMADNAGLGLFFIKELSRRSRGSFLVASKRNAIEVTGSEDGGGKQRYAEGLDAPIGTLAVLEIRTDGPDDFSALLETCRELAAKRRKDKTPYDLDFLDDDISLEEIPVVPVYEFEEDVDEAKIRFERDIEPKLKKEELIVLDFKGIAFATQSFCHALLYRLFRDFDQSGNLVSFQNCTDATKEAIIAVRSYAHKTPRGSG